MPFYHVSATPLAAGQILQPGAWGRTTRQFRRNGRALANINDATILAWESCLETARRVLAPKAPSRLDCIFACETTVGAASFRARFRPTATVYEIELVAAGAPTFTADYDLITDTGDEPFVDTWGDRSIRYWTSHPQGIAEVLIGGDVRVLRASQLR
jgi:hypothetical protein